MPDDDEIDDRWLFHTSGPNCHWCASGETAFVWGPYGTNICPGCVGRRPVEVAVDDVAVK